MAANNSQIRGAIRAIFQERFPSAELVRISIRDKASDEEDKEEIEVRLVIKAKRSEFSPADIPAFLTAVVGKLEDLDESRFPIISFIAESDKRKRHTAAA